MAHARPISDFFHPVIKKRKSDLEASEHCTNKCETASVSTIPRESNDVQNCCVSQQGCPVGASQKNEFSDDSSEQHQKGLASDIASTSYGAPEQSALKQFPGTRCGTLQGMGSSAATHLNEATAEVRQNTYYV